MRKLLATAGLVLALSGPAGAVPFTLSEGHGSGPFGEITGFFNNVAHTSYTLHVSMFANNIINTGGHWPLTISLNTGLITQTATTFAGLGGATPFTLESHIVAGTNNDYANAPFKYFSDAVGGNCDPTAGCGHDLWLTVSGVNPLLSLFNPATTLFGGINVYAAVDIFQAPGGPTFAVGLGNIPIIDQQCANPPCTPGAPGPLAGAGLPGLIAACVGLLGLARRRRQSFA